MARRREKMAILELSEVKSVLGLETENTSWDSLLSLLIAGVQAYLEQEIGCALDYQVYTNQEISFLKESKALPLPAWPVEEIISLEDSNSITYEEGTDYVLDEQSGTLFKIYDHWNPGVIYSVSFSAGYDFAAGEGSDLKMLALELVVQQWKRYKDKSFGESGRTFPDGSVSYSDLNLTERQKIIINAHKRYGL